MLHINIVGVVTYSDSFNRRLVTCIVGSFLNLFHFHITQFHCCNASITIEVKNENLPKKLANLVDNAAANKQLTVNITSNFSRYC